MEQIYYTQCPLGYGLGASNGFQIKRLSAGYPTTADFRHLGMKAFLPASKALAPRTLRYRRDGAVAEIAWLAPRPQEYLTERGPWGRPGGLFAHGLRLEPAELAALANWPAGLYGSLAWCVEDREPSRGRVPEPFAATSESFALPPRFAEVAALARNLDADWLARLLTALALSTREGRTLFLIDEPDRLAGLVQILTFAFPEPLRGELTFSTYHDRPEELTGFRLQGTVPAARPNRPVLASLGYIADAQTRAIEPPVAAESWATTLAGWLARGDAEAFAAWDTLTREYPGALRLPEAWQPGWLDHLMSFREATRLPIAPPTATIDWAALGAMAGWVRGAGVAALWLRARGARWWIAASLLPAKPPDMARAFLAQAQALRGVALADPPAQWGEAIARIFPNRAAEELFRAARLFLRELPAEARTPLMAGLMGRLGAEAAQGVLALVRDDKSFDRASLLPLESRGAVAALIDRDDREPLRALLVQSFQARARPELVLDAVELALNERKRGDRHAAAECLAGALDDADPQSRAHGLAWALRRGDSAEAWLRPYLRRVFDDADGPARWQTLQADVGEAGRPALAPLALTVALGLGVPPEAYCWAVEELLLRIDEAARPHDPIWADAYMARISFLDLVRRLFLKDTKHPELRRWLKLAIRRGELSAEAASRLDHCEKYARSLADSDETWLAQNRLPEVPPRDRGAMLGQILALVGAASPERLDLCLESCRRSWPGAFQAGVPGLDGLARPLARVLLPYRGEPAAWVENLRRIQAKLGLDGAEGPGFEPDSLAAEVVAATVRVHDPAEPAFEPWELRKTLLLDDSAWKSLAIDARRDLHGDDPTESATTERRRAEVDGEPPAPAVSRLWERQLEHRGTFARGAIGPRFFELMLNACDGGRLALLGAARAVDLGSQPSLRGLPWWRSRTGEFPGSPDDLREGFALTVPMAPLPTDSLLALRGWLGTPSPTFQTAQPRGNPAEPDGLVPLADESANEVYGLADVDFGHLSPLGQARWYCLDALTVFARGSAGDEFPRWRTLLERAKSGGLPLEWLGADEPYVFLAWLIHETRDFGAVPLPWLASELVKLNLTDGRRIAGWPDDLAGRDGTAGAGGALAPPGLREFLYELPREIDQRVREQGGRRGG